MPYRDLAPAQPPPDYDVLVSLPANLATAMVLLDYAAHRSATPTPWPQGAVRRLHLPARTHLRRLRAVLAHGTVLREFFLDRLDPGHPAHSDWEALLAWLERLSDEELEGLVTTGVIAGLAYYRTEMEPIPAVEELLSRLGTREPDPALLADPAARRLALEALLASWTDDPGGAVKLALDLDLFRSELVDLLQAIWGLVFAREWEEGASKLTRAADRARAVLAGGPWPAGESILRVTGLQPAAELEAPLRRARQLLFVPCLHLGRYLSITRAGLGWAPRDLGPDRFRIFYEPAPAWQEAGEPVIPGGDPSGKAVTVALPAGTGRGGSGAQVLELGHLVPALEALGDATRLAMLQLLRRQGELFAGQVAAALHLHPSTVSRHFAQLEAAGLVRSRKEGSVKYYRLDRERLRSVARLLEHELG